MQVNISAQLNQGIASALSGNTSAAASTITNDATKLAADISSGNTAAISQDTATLNNDVQAAVSSGAITLQQAATVLLPSQEETVGTGLNTSSTSGGDLAALFQKFCQVNNLPVMFPAVQDSWNQFVNVMSSSIPSFSTSAAQASVQAAEQFCVGDAPRQGTTQFPSGSLQDGFQGGAQVNTGYNSWGPSTGSASGSGNTQTPNFGDASSIEAAFPTLIGTVGSLGAYAAVKSSPTDQNAVNTYVNDLVAEAQDEGAGQSDRSALDNAITAALHGAGVSDSAISTALAQNSGPHSFGDYEKGFK